MTSASLRSSNYNITKTSELRWYGLRGRTEVGERSFPPAVRSSNNSLLIICIIWAEIDTVRNKIIEIIIRHKVDTMLEICSPNETSVNAISCSQEICLWRNWNLTKLCKLYNTFGFHGERYAFLRLKRIKQFWKLREHEENSFHVTTIFLSKVGNEFLVETRCRCQRSSHPSLIQSHGARHKGTHTRTHLHSRLSFFLHSEAILILSFELRPSGDQRRTFPSHTHTVELDSNNRARISEHNTARCVDVALRNESQLS